MRTMLTILVTGLAIAGCSVSSVGPEGARDAEPDRTSVDRPAGQDRIVVADRASGTISVIDAYTNERIAVHALPADASEPTPEPMYVVSVPTARRVFVGDRANDRVVAFDSHSFDVEGTAPTGNGVFHMWADPTGRQLWVNNDIDNTTTVVDPHTLSVIATVPTPADLVALGGKPHDVILGPKGRLAYVSVIGLSGDTDAVVQFDTETFQETARADVGKDPHLSLSISSGRPKLYVPCQNSNVVLVLDMGTLALLRSIDVPGAHGAGMSQDGRFFYTTNLPGAGAHALFTIDTRADTVAGMPTDSPYPIPHNIALTTNGRKMFVTHSGGTSDKVTVYELRGTSRLPALVDEVIVGLNPFGIAYVR